MAAKVSGEEIDHGADREFTPVGAGVEESAIEAPPPVDAPAPPPLHVRCANCGHFLIGPFCAQCGQRDADYHQSVWRLITEFFDNAFCWDSKLRRTLGPLLTRPGFLTQEFVIGRRASYVHPLRLFLFASAVCLTLITVGHRLRPAETHVVSTTELAEKLHKSHKKSASPAAAAQESPTGDATPSPGAGAPSASPNTPAAPPSALAELAAPLVQSSSPEPSASASPPPSASPKASAEEPSVTADLGRLIRDSAKGGKAQAASADQLAEIGKRVGKEIDEKSKAADVRLRASQVSQDVDRRLSWVALAMLPVFALILRAVYWRQESFYFTHLIFSLHYHSFLLIFWVVYTWTKALTGWAVFPINMISVLGLAVPPWYLYQSLRRLYWDGPALTAVRVVIVGALHALALVIGLSAVGSYSYFHP